MKDAWKLSESGLSELYDTYYQIGTSPTSTDEDQSTKSTIIVTRAEVGSKERQLLSGILKAINTTTEDCTIVSPEDYLSLQLPSEGHTLHFEPEANSSKIHSTTQQNNHTVVHGQTLMTYLSEITEKKVLWQTLKDTFDI